MAGTSRGSKKAVQTIKERYGEDWYKNMGKTGGKASNTGGFAKDPGLASRASKIGWAKRKGLQT